MKVSGAVHFARRTPLLSLSPVPAHVGTTTPSRSQRDRGKVAMSWQPEMDELRRRQELTRRMGGADKVKRQHDGGRLTVRERIDRLVDPGSFREIGSIARPSD